MTHSRQLYPRVILAFNSRQRVVLVISCETVLKVVHGNDVNIVRLDKSWLLWLYILTGLATGT